MVVFISRFLRILDKDCRNTLTDSSDVGFVSEKSKIEFMIIPLLIKIGFFGRLL